MKIRRYYGHDCDSAMGFNNGHYIDDDWIEVKNTDEAMQACKDFLAEHWRIKDYPDQLIEVDQGYEFQTGFYDHDGNDIKPDDFDDYKGHHYRYVYVTYEEEQ